MILRSTSRGDNVQGKLLGTWGAVPHGKEDVRMKMQWEIYKNAEKEVSAPGAMM
jgi:hypothetical protein